MKPDRPDPTGSLLAIAECGCRCGARWLRWKPAEGVRFACGCTYLIRGPRVVLSTPCRRLRSESLTVGAESV